MIAVMLATLLACAPGDPPASQDLDEAFSQAATDFGVPRELLVSVAYSLSRMDQRDGAVSAYGAVGLMNLYTDGRDPSIDDAARTLGYAVETLELDRVANLRGGAAILAGMASRMQARTGEPIDTMQEWYPVVAGYSGSDDPLVAEGFAAQVYDLMQYGFAVETPDGQWIEVPPQDFYWRVAPTTGSSLIAQYVPASSTNYTDSSRGSGDIDMVVVHTTEGSYSSAINWFQNSAANGSAHYVVRSSDGQITQMVDESDIAWHAGDWTTNQRSIGIEHEGYVSAPDTWYTDAMYRASAALTRDICDRYSIPIDRTHIIGHSEVPGCSSGTGGGASCHTDPGSGWDWDYYMYLVTAEGGSEEILAGGLDDGPRTGSFSATVYSSRTGITDTCSGATSGSVSGGSLYLNATCRLDDHGEQSGDLAVIFSGAVDRLSVLSGRVVVDGYADSWEGNVNDDGSVNATWSGSHDIGGDVGTLSYTATLWVNP